VCLLYCVDAYMGLYQNSCSCQLGDRGYLSSAECVRVHVCVCVRVCVCVCVCVCVTYGVYFRFDAAAVTFETNCEKDSCVHSDSYSDS